MLSSAKERAGPGHVAGLGRDSDIRVIPWAEFVHGQGPGHCSRVVGRRHDFRSAAVDNQFRPGDAIFRRRPDRDQAFPVLP